MQSFRRQDTVRLNKVIPRTETIAETGLSPEAAEERLRNGYGNIQPEPPTKTVGQIIKSNVFTYFNLIFFVLAACVALVGSFNDLTFLPVVFANIIIGIVQELRSKKTMDRLTFISEPQATVIRGGREVTVPAHETVLDDVVIFKAGEQIYADAVVLTGTCQCNESLVTGETDEITKKSGDTLLSGSFLVSGQCRARLDKVGRDSFVAQLTLEAKKSEKKKKSEMMGSLTRLVQIIGVLIIPVGALMYWQQVSLLARPIKSSVISTVAALIGMIPEGLYLLTSVALTVGILRLAKRRTLVHEMGCIETLARVDTLCVDKTGTITENAMTVKGIVPLCEEELGEEAIRRIMSDYVGATGDGNDTMAALKNYFGGSGRRAV
ncbi:MAG: HAD-IC family P-type ATPase, partial [Oscillospiraceae bacterium]|nr:HAD-IC family P-type ATPase [Oscillospiraceae bacterium]